MKQKKIKKILIFGHSNIGDVCYDMVVVHPLRIAFPDAIISFVTSPKGIDIGKAIKGIDEVINFDKHGKDKGLLGYLRFIKKIRAEKFDVAIILRSMQMDYFFGIQNVIKFRKNDIPRKDMHVAQKYLKLLEVNGIKAGKAEFELESSKEDMQFIKELFKRNSVRDKTLRIGIMPLAAWPLKCWPIEHWNKLIEKLIDQGNNKVFLFGKTSQGDWDKQLKMNISKKAVSLIDCSTISQSIALISSLDIFIGLDSSFLHIASCMRIETIGLYGATSPDFIFPLFHKHNIIYSKANLECMPCYPGPHGGSCNAHEPAACMQAISVNEVFKKIVDILNSQKDKLKASDKA